MAGCETNPLDLTVRRGTSDSTSSAFSEQALDLTKKPFQIPPTGAPPRGCLFASPYNAQARSLHASPIPSMKNVFEQAQNRRPLTNDVASFLPAFGMPSDNATLTLLQRSMLSGLFERSQQMITAANCLQNLKTAEKCASSVRHHCTYCGWQCDSLTMTVPFKQHLEDHAKQIGSCYKCAYCSDEFHDPNVLKEHLITHPFLHQHVCSFCSMAFYHEDFLQAHIKVHDLSKINNKPSHSKEQCVSPPRRKQASSSCTTLTDTKACTNSPPAETKELSVIGQSLAKHIEQAIAKELTSSDAPKPSNIGDLIFMTSRGAANPSKKQLPKVQEGGLNLLSLLGKVVEQGLESETEEGGRTKQLKFMVTFSDDENDGFSSLAENEGKVCRRKVRTQKAECTSSVQEQEQVGNPEINVLDEPSSSNEAEAREKINPNLKRKRLKQTPQSPASSDGDSKPSSSCDSQLPNHKRNYRTPKRCKSA